MSNTALAFFRSFLAEDKDVRELLSADYGYINEALANHYGIDAGDRPYKNAMPMSQALTILGRMKLENHVDPDLFDVFMWEKVYQKYADKFLDAEQCDDFVLNDIPGYVPPPQ